MPVAELNDSSGQARPLFICGNARGGTTLLVRLLDGHPELLVLPTETQIYPALATRWVARWLLRAAEFSGCRRGVALLARPGMARLAFHGRPALAVRLRRWAREYPHSRPLSDDAIDAAAAHVRGPHQYWRAFLDVFARSTGMDVEGKCYWVEKTPAAERFAAVSDAWYGRSGRFLHVIRDPRDFIASSLLLGTRLGVVRHRERQIVRFCFIWSQSVAWCRHGMRTLVGRYRALRYEDLVRQPREVMTAVCAFLEIPMDGRLLVSTRLGEPVALNSSDLAAPGAPGEIVPSRVGRFTELLSPGEVRTIERLLGAQMSACGYAHATAPARSARDLFGDLAPAVRRHPRTMILALATDRAQAPWRRETMPLIGARGPQINEIQGESP